MNITTFLIGMAGSLPLTLLMLVLVILSVRKATKQTKQALAEIEEIDTHIHVGIRQRLSYQALLNFTVSNKASREAYILRNNLKVQSFPIYTLHHVIQLGHDLGFDMTKCLIEANQALPPNLKQFSCDLKLAEQSEEQKSLDALHLAADEMNRIAEEFIAEEYRAPGNQWFWGIFERDNPTIILNPHAAFGTREDAEAHIKDTDKLFTQRVIGKEIRVVAGIPEYKMVALPQDLLTVGEQVRAEYDDPDLGIVKGYRYFIDGIYKSEQGATKGETFLNLRASLDSSSRILIAIPFEAIDAIVPDPKLDNFPPDGSAELR